MSCHQIPSESLISLSKRFQLFLKQSLSRDSNSGVLFFKIDPLGPHFPTTLRLESCRRNNERTTWKFLMSLQEIQGTLMTTELAAYIHLSFVNKYSLDT